MVDQITSSKLDAYDRIVSIVQSFASEGCDADLTHPMYLKIEDIVLAQQRNLPIPDLCSGCGNEEWAGGHICMKCWSHECNTSNSCSKSC